MPSTVPLSLWQRLSSLAERLWEMKPWSWMREWQIFAVRDPEDPERLGFVSVMGSGDAFPAVSVYLGREALFDFRQIILHPQDLPLEEVGRKMMLVPQLMLSYVQREEVPPQDLEVLKAVGWPLHREVWPVFRSHRPAHYPWFLEEDEARFLAVALEQTLAVAPLVRAGEVDLRPESHPTYYLRRRTEHEGEPRWEGRWEKVEPPPLRRVRFSLPESLIAKATALPQGEDLMEVQMDLALEVGPLQDQPDQRPYFPYLFLAVQPGERPQVLNAKLVRPAEPGALAESFARLLLETLQQWGRRPREVRMAPRAHYVQVAQWLSVPLAFRVRVEPLTALPERWASIAKKP